MGLVPANKHLSVELGGESGVVQLCRIERGWPQLQAPIALSRFRDHGEFWDAWDLPADYRGHPLPVQWDGGVAGRRGGGAIGGTGADSCLRW